MGEVYGFLNLVLPVCFRVVRVFRGSSQPQNPGSPFRIQLRQPRRSGFPLRGEFGEFGGVVAELGAYFR